jgi:hypothetical protein
MPYLQSAAIETIAYDETTHRLRAKFRKSGRTVIYDDVPLEIYDALIFADSIGAFIRDRIEGVYPARDLRDKDRAAGPDITASRRAASPSNSSAMASIRKR